MKTTLTLSLGILCLFGAMLAQGAAPPVQGAGDTGKEPYRVNCAGCHKWDGQGGGGYGGAALSLRQTGLDRAQIVMTVSCGRPGTGMPYHLRDAYTEAHPCYGMTSLAPLGNNRPLEANNFLRRREIDAVAGYVITHIKGRGKATFAECQAFWGVGSRVCDDYPKTPGNPGGENQS